MEVNNPTPTTSAPTPPLNTKPLWRGVIHEVAFFVSLVSGPALILEAHGAKAKIAVSIYAFCITALFGFSALLHRRYWSPKGRKRMRRIDHSMIFLAIAGTYTPIVTLALSGFWSHFLLVLVWSGAAVGIVIKSIWIDAPKWLAAIVYSVVGWAAILAAPELISRLGTGGFSLLIIGGILYTLGAAVYASRWPNPNPKVFGFHEVFHTFVTIAAITHYLVIAIFVLPGVK